MLDLNKKLITPQSICLTFFCIKRYKGRIPEARIFLDLSIEWMHSRKNRFVNAIFLPVVVLVAGKVILDGM